MCFCSMDSSLLCIQLIVILVPFTMALFYLAGFNEIIERLRIFNDFFVYSSHDIYRWKSAMPIQMCQLHESSGISDTTCITSCLLEEG